MMILNNKDYLYELGLVIRAHASQFVTKKYTDLLPLFDLADFGVELGMFNYNDDIQDDTVFIAKHIEIYPTKSVLVSADYLRFLCAKAFAGSNIEHQKDLIDEMVNVGINAICFMSDQISFQTEREWVNKEKFGRCNAGQLDLALGLMKSFVMCIAKDINNYVSTVTKSICTFNRLNQIVMAKRLIKTPNITVRFEIEGRYLDLVNMDYTEINSLTCARMERYLTMDYAPCRFRCQIYHNDELIGESSRDGQVKISQTITLSGIVFRHLLITAVKKAREILPKQPKIISEEPTLSEDDLYWSSLSLSSF